MQQKKYRNKLGLFVAEGLKTINELLNGGYKLHSLYTVDDSEIKEENKQVISARLLQKMSSLKNASSSLALFEIPPEKPIIEEGIIVALDKIGDPGNLGTIIRLCDWFGISQLICSQDTVDLYNPKVIQACMGSNARVNVSKINLLKFIKNSKLAIYGACMDGENIYEQDLSKEAIIVLGNEANGISKEVLDTILKKIAIPRFGVQQKTESLNVASATAILLSEFKRFTER